MIVPVNPPTKEGLMKTNGKKLKLGKENDEYTLLIFLHVFSCDEHFEINLLFLPFQYTLLAESASIFPRKVGIPDFSRKIEGDSVRRDFCMLFD